MELERRQQKARSAAPRKLEKLQAQIEKAEAQLEELEAELLKVGADASRALALSEEQQQKQGEVDELYAQWEKLEELLATPA